MISKYPPEIQNVVTCLPDQTAREIGDKFVESPANVLIVADRDDAERICSIITLHALFRAQASYQN